MGVMNCTHLVGPQNEGHTSNPTTGHVARSSFVDSEGPAFVIYVTLLSAVHILRTSGIGL